MTLEHEAVERLLRTEEPVEVPADAVVAAAVAARRPGRSTDVDEPASPLEVYRDRVADFAAAVTPVASDGWGRRAEPYPWTVHQLVAHLAAIEEYCGYVLGIPGSAPPPESELDHLAMTEPAVQAAASVDPHDTVAAWHAAATRLADHLEAAGQDALAERVVLHGFPMSVRSMLIVRGFELWTHADDVRRATGRATVDPPANVLHTMSTLSVFSLPLPTAIDRPVTARVVLTGRGGGAWTIGLGGPPGDEPDVEVLALAVDWCRMASRRIEADRLDATVDGDADLANRLLAAAQTLAF